MEHTSLSVLCSKLISLLLLWQKSVHTFLNCAGKYKSVHCFYTQRQYLCPSHTINQREVGKHLTKQWWVEHIHLEVNIYLPGTGLVRVWYGFGTGFRLK